MPIEPAPPSGGDASISGSESGVAAAPPASPSSSSSSIAPLNLTPSPPLAQVPYGGDAESGTSGAVAAVIAPSTVPQSLLTDYGGDEGNSVQPAAAEESHGLSCEDAELKQIVEKALRSSADNLNAARKIESDAATKFGGRFNSIVSNNEFAYVNW